MQVTGPRRRSVRRPGPSQIKMYGFCRPFRAMPTHTDMTLVWVPSCDSRNRASQYQRAVAPWQRRIRQEASGIARQEASGMERERDEKRTLKEWPSPKDQSRNTIRCYTLWTLRDDASRAGQSDALRE